MPTDFLEQLAELDVPPPPVEFNRDLHEKLNQSLTALHVFDLLLRALPIAGAEFIRAVGGLLSLTVTGKFPEKKDQR